jgi:hypothetical protein
MDGHLCSSKNRRQVTCPGICSVQQRPCSIMDSGPFLQWGTHRRFGVQRPSGLVEVRGRESRSPCDLSFSRQLPTRPGSVRRPVCPSRHKGYAGALTQQMLNIFSVLPLATAEQWKSSLSVSFALYSRYLPYNSIRALYRFAE